jgi:hypothetical protein
VQWPALQPPRLLRALPVAALQQLPLQALLLLLLLRQGLLGTWCRQ